MRLTLSTPPRRERGFTLLELLMVVAIMGIVMMMAVAAFVDIGRGAGMKSTVLNLRASMSHARQYAITKRAKTHFMYGNTNWEQRLTGYYFFTTDRSSNATPIYSVIGITNYTVDGILFGTANNPPLILRPNQPTNIVFDTDGSCVDDGSWSVGLGNFRRSIVLLEALRDGSARRPRGLVTTTDVYRLTGRVKGSGWVNE